MTNFRTATALLLLLPNFVAAQDENCVGVDQLGTPSLDRLGYSVSMDVDDACEYALKISFKHDETLPSATNPMTQCDPTFATPEMASDGLPFFAFRWHYQAVSDEIKEVTGIDHISIDWNACGHPPVEIFGAPHYDLHIYRETPEFRACMTCATPPGVPVCDTTPGAQTTPNGLGFFNVAMVDEEDATPAVVQRVFDPNGQPKNMPAGFIVGMQDMVPLMGGHAWNPNQTPPSSSEWVNPVWVMGPYDGGIIDYEPMIPFAFMSGDSDNRYTEFLSYEGQTIDELPSSYTLEYDGTTKMVTLTLTGPGASGSCEKPVEEPVEELPEPALPTLPVLPYIGDLIENAYPTWCIDENENRLYDAETCEDGTPNGRFSPLYFTKQHSGGDPALGGYPTNIDISYAFEFAAPYLGQACAGSPHMCREDFDGSTINCKKCPKLKTDHDNGPYGPGHVPPHISLAAVSRAYEEGMGGDISEWFDFDANACRILPNKLLSLIRLYYPREEDGSVYYPPPFSDLGGAYPLEFVNLAGETCKKEAEKHSTAGNLECFEDHSGEVSQFPNYLEVGHGSPHYCTKEGKAADVNPDYCPYIFFGPHRGKYRHPHIAFSAVEVYLSNIVMPDKCGTAWDDSNYPAPVDTTVAFPYMSDIEVDDDLVNHPQQPTMKEGMWCWPGPEGTKRKPVVGFFAVDLYTAQDSTWKPNQSDDKPEVTKNEIISIDTEMDTDIEMDEIVEASGSVSVLIAFAFSATSIVMTSLLF